MHSSTYTLEVVDQDFGHVPTHERIELPIAARGFERIAQAADDALITVLREDFALAQLENLASS